MVYIEEITEYFNEIFRLLGQKVLMENQNLLNIFTIGGFGTACKMSFIAKSTTSGFSKAEGNYKILNLYDSGVGGGYSENRYKLYLVPVQAHISYSNDITLN